MHSSFDADAKEFDVIVAGSGAAGLATAVSCRILGLSTMLLEASPWIGGSTALSGGVLWIPGNPYRPASPEPEDLEHALAYIRAECGTNFDQSAARAFVQAAGASVKFLAEQGGLAYTGPAFWPDYHQELHGAREGGRSMRIEDFDGRLLGEVFSRLRRPLRSMTLFGGMMVGGNDLYHLLRARRSLKSAAHVAKILTRHFVDRLSHPRGTRLCNGSALVARLLYRYLELGGKLSVDTCLTKIVRTQGQIAGCEITSEARGAIALKCRALVLAGGGVGGNHDLRRTLGSKAFPPDFESISLSPPSVRGDNICAAVAIGARIDQRQHDMAAWVPVSKIGGGNCSKPDYFPHFFDRSKPGFILINDRGERFVNEASSYHDIGACMVRLGVRVAYILCDQAALRRYGVGVVPPGAPRLSRWIRDGYLVQAENIKAMAQRLGVGEDELGRTVADYNRHAVQGVDPVFRKGQTPYEKYIGDPEHAPNPCVAPLSQGPFYAVRVQLGDIGTFCGLATQASGLVLDDQEAVIPGLFAVGNDRASIFGGTYPAAGITLGPALTHAVTTAHSIAGLSWPPKQ
jgi:succinate dehydrogenase/fumarate reductase flavoprotein subunit